MAEVLAASDFYGLSEGQLLAALRAAQAEKLSGGAITGTQTSPLGVQLLVKGNPEERIALIKQALYGFFSQDNVTYAAYENFAGEGYSEAQAVFS